ncbi:CPBP family glutamic-type intramembrane protease [Thermophagus sp. OGC60D27]|uniref:CPBP family glutamic-type intramembrane protease n=1 Tax=Thermophagus sp. OGC60D27 TaxID=3458415 RepID=UPI00403796FE
MMQNTGISDKRRWFEINAVILTGVLKYILVDWLEFRLFYISSAVLFWVWYILSSYQANRQILINWGFRREGFFETFKYCFPFTLFAFLVIGFYEVRYGEDGFLRWSLLPVLVLYPIWGLIQQFLMIGIIAGNLRDIKSLKFRENQSIIIVSILFSFAHFPDLLLMGFTLVMELFFISAYFQWKNLWSLGILHGWLGGLFLYLVSHRDLWLELWVVF